VKNKILIADSVEDAFTRINDMYWDSKNENSLSDLLAGIEIHGLSIEDVSSVYGLLFYQIEGDKTVRLFWEYLDEGKYDIDLGWKLWE
jgi:hypothetical protein